jgi:hypothetical protein
MGSTVGSRRPCAIGRDDELASSSRRISRVLRDGARARGSRPRRPWRPGCRASHNARAVGSAAPPGRRRLRREPGCARARGRRAALCLRRRSRPPSGQRRRRSRPGRGPRPVRTRRSRRRRRRPRGGSRNRPGSRKRRAPPGWNSRPRGGMRRGSPVRVALGQAARARPVAGGDRRRLVGEEDPVAHVVAAGDPAQRRGAVEPAVDLAAAMTSEPAGRRRCEFHAVPADQPVTLHRGRERYGQPYRETPESRTVRKPRSCEVEAMSYRDTCLACGEPLGPTLAFAASLRCHDCRACRAPLRAEHVEQARFSAGPGASLQLPAGHPQYGRLAA